MLGVAGDEADRDALGQRQVDHAGEAPGVVVAVLGRDHPFELVGRVVGGDRHRPADGVAAEQGALRPAQHFDPGDVDEGHVAAGEAAEIDAIDISADRRIDRRDDILRHLAADRQQLARRVAERRGGEAGRDALKRFDVDDLPPDQGLLLRSR